jgi:hypothetical protein
MLHQLYIPRNNDEKIIQGHLAQFKQISDEKIIERIQVEKQYCIKGVHQQALYIIAIYQAAQESNLDIELSNQLDYVIYSS